MSSSTRTKTDRLLADQLTTYDSQGYGDGDTISTGPAYLLKAVVTNKGAGTLWACFFNSATASGAPAIAPVAVPAGSTIVVDLQAIGGAGFLGPSFPAGLTWAASSAAVFAQDSSNSLWLSAVLG